MSSELDKLQLDATRLAEQFGKKGFSTIQRALEMQAQEVAELANLARQFHAPKRFPSSTDTSELPSENEQLPLRDNFTTEEIQRLLDDGALVYTLRRETVMQQIIRRDREGKPSFSHLNLISYNVLNVASKQMQLAIYPDPEKAFIPGSFHRNAKQTEELLAIDSDLMRSRLKLPGIGLIIPQAASTITSLIFQHNDTTGEWFLGPDYALDGPIMVYARTNNTTNESGTNCAVVGAVSPQYGINVENWDRN